MKNFQEENSQSTVLWQHQMSAYSSGHEVGGMSTFRNILKVDSGLLVSCQFMPFRWNRVSQTAPKQVCTLIPTTHPGMCS